MTLKRKEEYKTVNLFTFILLPKNDTSWLIQVECVDKTFLHGRKSSQEIKEEHIIMNLLHWLEGFISGWRFWSHVKAINEEINSKIHGLVIGDNWRGVRSLLLWYLVKLMELGFQSFRYLHLPSRSDFIVLVSQVTKWLTRKIL